MPRHRLTRRAADAGLIVLFLALIGLPASRNLLGSGHAAGVAEQRTLAPMPAWSLDGKQVRRFPARFEAFYNDHFGYRDELVCWLHAAQVQWLRVSSSPRVILGRHGWLFFNDVPLNRDEAIRPLTPDQLAAWQHLLEARRDWLAERGIRFLFVVAPDKQTIYPEYLPRAVAARHVEGLRLNQLLEHLRQHSDVAAVDLRGPLRDAKERERVYHQADSHWNDRGAFVASEAITAALSPWFNAMRPLPRAAFHQETGPYIGDCARLLTLADRFREEDVYLTPPGPARVRVTYPPPTGPVSPIAPLLVLEQDAPQLPRALVFRDSFGAALAPLLAEHFRRTVCVWQDVSTFDRARVEEERPDVVIQEMVERKLAYPDLVDKKHLHPGPSQRSEFYLSNEDRAWLSCLHGE